MYDKLSEERKRLQSEGNMPEWFSTGGWQLFKEKYLYKAKNPREQYERIARTLASHMPNSDLWYDRFFQLMWYGWLSPSTPVLANTGTERGLPVSCAGSYIGDSIDEIYKAKHEIAMLTKMGFGTASYVGDIRPRGSGISVGGKSVGTLPVNKGVQFDMEYVAQGTARRGSWAAYTDIDHPDFWEIAVDLRENPDGNNVGWCVSDDFIRRMREGDEDANARYAEAMYTKMVSGKGYFFFTDKANEKRPEWYKERDLDIKSPQLCNEIMLHSSKDYTYTCVLASMNAAKYNEWKNTQAVQWATVFLDCVVSEFLEKGRNVPGLEKAIASTEKGRALGLGICGFHSHLMDNQIPYESFDAYLFNEELFKHLKTETEKATKWLAKQFGECEWCKGHGRRNTHCIAVAPTKSTALIMGGVSEGISPIYELVFTQRTPAGEVDRVDPILLKIMKERGVFNKKVVEDIREKGSVQHVTWLNDHEKMVFKTAFEIDQRFVLKLGSSRGKYIDQWQSLNLFFPAGVDEDYINEVHITAFEDPNVLGLYYIYSKASIQASNDKDECVACQ